MNVERLPEWQRAIPVGFRFATRNGGDAVLSLVELWSDRVILYFGWEVTTPPLTGPGGQPRIGPGFLLADDLGTAYRPNGGGAGGGRDLHFGRQEFQPAVPEGASTLYVSSPELLDPISLSLEAGSPGR
jgi:hypothetical protein